MRREDKHTRLSVFVKVNQIVFIKVNQIVFVKVKQVTCNTLKMPKLGSLCNLGFRGREIIEPVLVLFLCYLSISASNQRTKGWPTNGPTDGPTNQLTGVCSRKLVNTLALKILIHGLVTNLDRNVPSMQCLHRDQASACDFLPTQPRRRRR